MRSLTRAKIVPLLAAGMLAALAACGGGGGSSPQASESGGRGPGPRAHGAGDHHLLVLGGQRQGDEGPLHRSSRHEHPNITVEFQEVPAEESEKKLTTQIAGGNPPDAAYVDASNVAVFGPRKALVNLENYISRSDIVEARRLRRGLQDSRPRWTAPCTGCRSTVSRPACSTGPTCSRPPASPSRRRPGRSSRPRPQKLTDPAKKQYGFQVFAPEAAYYWYPWLWQNGGELRDRSRTRPSRSTMTRASRPRTTTSG